MKITKLQKDEFINEYSNCIRGFVMQAERHRDQIKEREELPYHESDFSFFAQDQFLYFIKEYYNHYHSQHIAVKEAKKIINEDISFY